MRARSRCFFSPSRAKTREIACVSRQQFFLGKKLVEQLRVVRHGAQTAADIEFEAAPHFPVLDARDGDGAHVVHVHQAAGFLAAAGEGDLELAAEVLRVRVAEHELCRGPRIRNDVERLRCCRPRPAGTR